MHSDEAIHPAHPQISVRYCHKVICRLAGGDEFIGLESLDSMSNEVAFRFWRLANAKAICFPKACVRGIARRVFAEAIARRDRDPRTAELDHAPDIPADGEYRTTDVREEFLARLRQILSPAERNALREFADSGKHTRSQRAKEIGTTTRALTVATNRMLHKSRGLRCDMIAEALRASYERPDKENSARLLDHAKTPRERLDFCLHILTNYNAHHLEAFKMSLCACESCLPDTRYYFSLLTKAHDPAADDPAFSAQVYEQTVDFVRFEGLNPTIAEYDVETSIQATLQAARFRIILGDNKKALKLLTNIKDAFHFFMKKADRGELLEPLLKHAPDGPLRMALAELA